VASVQLLEQKKTIMKDASQIPAIAEPWFLSSYAHIVPMGSAKSETDLEAVGKVHFVYLFEKPG